MAKTWKISASNLNRLWYQMYPRIVAYMWRNTDPLFKKAFKRSEKFRKEQFAKLGVEVPEKMHVYFSKDEGSIDMILGSKGIILPDPTSPPFKHVLNMYQVHPPGWGLPGLKPKKNEKQANQDVFLRLDKRTLDTDYPPDGPFPKLETWEWSMQGNVYGDLITAVPTIIAYAWEDYDFYKSFIRRDAKQVLLGADVHIPSNVKVRFDGRRNQKDAWISNEKIFLPFPPKPESIEDFYDAWERGEAPIPTFTTSRGGGGPG